MCGSPVSESSLYTGEVQLFLVHFSCKVPIGFDPPSGELPPENVGDTKGLVCCKARIGVSSYK